MKLLLRLSKEAIRYKNLYIVAILSTLCLTVVNLAAPRVLSRMTGIENGVVTESGTHDELLALDGSYARMHRIQSTPIGGVA